MSGQPTSLEETVRSKLDNVYLAWSKLDTVYLAWSKLDTVYLAWSKLDITGIKCN